MQSPITTALINSAAGSLGGIVSYSVFYPLESFRTRLQVRTKDDISPSFNENSTPTLHDVTITSQPSTFSSIRETVWEKLQQLWDNFLETLQFARSIYDKHGIAGFYQGLGAGIFGIGVSNAVYMYWYQLLKDLLLQFRKLGSIYLSKIKNSKRPVLLSESKPHQHTLSPLDNIIVASLAGVVNITITSPIWLINTRQILRDKQLNSQPTNAKNLIDTQTTPFSAPTFSKSPIAKVINFISTLPTTLRTFWNWLVDYFTSTELYKIVQNEGFLELYKGYAASLVLVLNPTIQYVLYDQLVAYIQGRRAKTNNNQNQGLSSAEYFLLSAFCKACSTVITFPYQVVKARQQQEQQTTCTNIIKSLKTISGLQTDNNQTDPRDKDIDIVTELTSIKNKEEVLSLYSTMVQMYQEEGMEVFFRGLVPKLIQTVSNTALTTVLHERMKEYMLGALLEKDE